MENINDFFQGVLERVREKANKTGEIQYAVADTGHGEIYYKIEPDAIRYPITGIPKLYKDCSFDTFKGNDKLITAIKKAIESESHIVLVGNTGCGKTHLAISTLKQYEKHERHFTSTQEVLLDIRESFRKESRESEAEVIDKYTGCGVLVLDDLGSEKTSEYSITTLYLIIDRRIRDCKPTIITTNLTLKEIEDKLSARIASRLSSMMIFKINMPDWRKKRG